MSYFVYILRSVESGRFYIGYSADPDRRLSEHNAGKVTSTKAHLPWALAYREEHRDRAGAMRRERRLKSMKSAAYLRNLIDDQFVG